MMLTAVIPRWWTVSSAQIHYVGSEMRYAEELLAEAALSPQRRAQVIAGLEPYAPPARLKKVERLLADGDVQAAEDNVVPSEMFLLASEMSGKDQDSPMAADLRRQISDNSAQLSTRATGGTFGTPKPTLATSVRAGALEPEDIPDADKLF